MRKFVTLSCAIATGTISNVAHATGDSPPVQTTLTESTTAGTDVRMYGLIDGIFELSVQRTLELGDGQVIEVGPEKEISVEGFPETLTEALDSDPAFTFPWKEELQNGLLAELITVSALHVEAVEPQQMMLMRYFSVSSGERTQMSQTEFTDAVTPKTTFERPDDTIEIEHVGMVEPPGLPVSSLHAYSGVPEIGLIVSDSPQGTAPDGDESDED